MHVNFETRWNSGAALTLETDPTSTKTVISIGEQSITMSAVGIELLRRALLGYSSVLSIGENKFCVLREGAGIGLELQAGNRATSALLTSDGYALLIGVLQLITTANKPGDRREG